MKLYVFSSTTLTNIWAGVGAETWAVAPAEPGSPHEKGRITKAGKMPIGAFGILYSSEHRALTVPFVIYSKAEDRTVSHIWDSDWALPFRTKPLGTPHRVLTIEDAKSKLPIFQQDPVPAFNNVFRVRADFAFQTSEIGDDDWSVLIKELAV